MLCDNKRKRCSISSYANSDGKRNPDFSVLVEAVAAAGLVDTLKGSGPFTVFAPTNEAFTAALTALGVTKEQLFADKELLTKILTYHVVAGKVLAADVVTLNGQEVATVEGSKVKVTVDGSMVKVDAAKQYSLGMGALSLARTALEILPADYWRYYLMANAPESADSNFTWAHFAGVVNKDLADVLGNFVSRVTKFCAARPNSFDRPVKAPRYSTPVLRRSVARRSMSVAA